MKAKNSINKYIGELVQGDITGDESLDSKVKAYLKQKYNKPGDVFLGVVHRLDRPVSGVVIFARTSKALTRLNKMFQEKEVKKLTKRGASYYKITRGGKDIFVVPAVGHLFVLSELEPNRQWSYPVFSVEGIKTDNDNGIIGCVSPILERGERYTL